MTQALNQKKIAILIADGFEQVEMTEPRKALDNAGAQTYIISPNGDTVQGWNHFDKGNTFPVDVTISSANPADYDALLLPGGVANPDQLRVNEKAVQFVQAFFTAGKPVAAICHAPWTLIEAAVVKDRHLTSWSSLQTDLKNAGAHWVDQEVVIDRGLITSRNPQDIPAFNRAIIEAFATGEPQARTLSTVG